MSRAGAPVRQIDQRDRIISPDLQDLAGFHPANLRGRPGDGHRAKKTDHVQDLVGDGKIVGEKTPLRLAFPGVPGLVGAIHGQIFGFREAGFPDPDRV